MESIDLQYGYVSSVDPRPHPAIQTLFCGAETIRQTECVLRRWYIPIPRYIPIRTTKDVYENSAFMAA
jgi:hypothetical protein